MFRTREGRGRMLVGAVLVATIVTAASATGRAEEATAAPAPGGSVDDHIAALGSLDPAARIAAIRALGESGEARAVPPLARVLREDPSAEVRGWAVRALAGIGTPEAMAPLTLAAEHDADQRVRQLAARMSGATTPPAQTAAPAPAPVLGPAVQAQPVQVAPGPMRGPFRPRQRRPGLALIIAGWSAFGASYLVSMIAGAATLAEGAEHTWSLFLPVIGPVVEAGMLFSDYDELIAPVAVLLFLDALIQIAGVSMGTVGLVRRHRARQAQEDAEADTDAEPEPEARARSWGFAVVPSTQGLSVSGWF